MNREPTQRKALQMNDKREAVRLRFCCSHHPARCAGTPPTTSPHLPLPGASRHPSYDLPGGLAHHPGGLSCATPPR